jgi:tight adherence protein B
MTILLILLLTAITIGGVGFALAGGDTSQDKALKRAQALTPASAKGAKVGATAQETAATRRKQIVQNLKAVEQQQRRQSVTLEGRMNQAGINPDVRMFWIISAALAAVCGGLGFVISHNPLIGLGAAFVMGLGLPRWVLGVLAKRRLKRFTAEFPNATDIIVRGIKSGLPVHECLKVIAKEMPQPLSGEFQRLVEGLGMGQSIDEALEKVYARMPTSEVRFFAIVLAIQQKTGGNLAEALGNLSNVLRGRKMLREKIKALSGEAVASAGIIGSLPPAVMILVSITTPSYMKPLFTDPRGHIMIMIGIFWMSCGIFVMRKMINFKF